MGIYEIVLLSIGLAMDAFGVAISKGLTMTSYENHKRIILALLFGLFQMIMPLIGWLIGSQFTSYIDEYAHWIICVLLGYLGMNMIRNSFQEDEASGEEVKHTTSWAEMFMLSIATSIDALAVGLTFAFLAVNVWWASSIIGIITFGISLFGIFAGRLLGEVLQAKAEMLGGIVLIVIGLKILL